MATRKKKADQRTSDQIRDVLVETVNVELATLRAGAAFWSAWVDQATVFSREATKVLADLNEEDSGDAVGRLADSSQKFLRAISDLPRIASEAFEQEVEASTRRAAGGASKPVRRRRARAKA